MNPWTTVLIILVVLALVLWLGSRSQEGFEETIYVSVAAYRDAECLRTVSDAFEKASNPGRIYVGICQQNKEASESCTVGLKVDPSHVRTIDLKHTQAKGPTYARYLCSTLYRGEDFFLQIDSHTRFTAGWDDSLIEALRKCPSSKPAISSYPHSYDAGPGELDEQVTVMCRSKWNSDGLPTFEAVMKPKSTAALRQVPFIAGGMLFAPGSLLKDVPMDPSLDFVFNGEEVLLSARLYTHGYDVFTPPVNVVLHHYVREKSPRFWNDLQHYRHRQQESLERVRQLLGLAKPDISMTDPYGMGRVRSLDDWWKFARLDPANKTSASAEFFCRD